MGLDRMRSGRLMPPRKLAAPCQDSRPEEPMPLDQGQVRDFTRTYTEAWCSHDPARVADHYTPGGTIAINDGEPTEITEVARSFMSAFPDIQVFTDDVVVKEEAVEYHWTFTGTNTGPG